MYTCGNISISEILYHYHDMENYIMIIDKLFLIKTLQQNVQCSNRTVSLDSVNCLDNY